MASRKRSANRGANTCADDAASGGEVNLASKSGGREEELSGPGGRLGRPAPEPGALRPLAKALIDLAISILAEEEDREEKAA